MSPSPSPRRLSLIVALALLAFPAQGSSAPFAPAAFFGDLRSLWARFWPGGGTANPQKPYPPVEIDVGCELDPIGRCLNLASEKQFLPVPIDQGCEIEPIGRCQQ